MCVVEVYTLLDNSSQSFFMLESLVSHLGVKGRKQSLAIKTLNEEATNDFVAW